MDIDEILSAVKNGEMTVEEAELKLKLKPFEDIGYAKIDHHRLYVKVCRRLYMEHPKLLSRFLISVSK